MMLMERKRMQVGDKRGGGMPNNTPALVQGRKMEVIARWRAVSGSVWEQQGLFQSNRRFKRLSWQKGK